MTIILDPDRPSPSQVDGRVLVPLRRYQIEVLIEHAEKWPTDEAIDDLILLDYARRNPELP